MCDSCSDEDGPLAWEDSDEAAEHWGKYFTLINKGGWEPWKASKTGFRCSACQHVLPWLHDQPRALCAKCSKDVGRETFKAVLLEKIESRKSPD